MNCKHKSVPSRHLVVAGDDNDADAGLAAVLDRVDHLLAGRIQHTDHTDERAVRLQTTRNRSGVYKRWLLPRVKVSG